jgi:hypothetical protein
MQEKNVDHNNCQCCLRCVNGAKPEMDEKKGKPIILYKTPLAAKYIRD